MDLQRQTGLGSGHQTSSLRYLRSEMTRGPLPDPSLPELWHETVLKTLAQSSDGQSAAGASATVFKRRKRIDSAQARYTYTDIHQGHW